jgi:S-adenosylhomocysteine hydrolase
MESAGICTGRRALVIGYGAIGAAVAAELRRRRRHVAVYDADRGRRVLAERDGHATYDHLHPALARGGLIVGCTGKAVLDRPDYPRIPDGAVLVSASSADVEFCAWQLRPSATCLGRPESWGSSNRNGHHPCFSLYRVRNGSRRFYLVNGGFPVNFNGGVDPIPPEKIQLTRGLLYIGAVQASRATEPGLHELDDRPQRMLMEAYTAEGERRAA